MTTLDDVVEVVRENHPYSWCWKTDVLRNWIAFHVDNSLLICVSTNMRDIEGLAMWRLLMRPEDGCGNSVTHDPEGNVVFLDFIFAPSNDVLRALVIAIIKQIGRRELVAWERRETLRVYPAWRFVSHTLRKEAA